MCFFSTYCLQLLAEMLKLYEKLVIRYTVVDFIIVKTTSPIFLLCFGIIYSMLFPLF